MFKKSKGKETFFPKEKGRLRMRTKVFADGIFLWGGKMIYGSQKNDNAKENGQKACGLFLQRRKKARGGGEKDGFENDRNDRGKKTVGRRADEAETGRTQKAPGLGDLAVCFRPAAFGADCH